MVNGGNLRYRYQSMKVIRGREATAISKMQGDGWELHSQTQGRLRTEMTFRRLRSPMPWRLIAAASALVLIAVAVLGGLALTRGGDDQPREAAPPPTSPASTTPTASDSDPTTEPTETESAPTAPADDQVLTVDNNSDLQALLTSPENGGSSKTFANVYAGRTIEFDGNVAAASPHGSYDTRFDFLIMAGNFSRTVAGPGPSFQFRDVNFYDLNVQGRGSSVGTGDNLRIVAEVGTFEPRTGLFLLTPVSTRLR